MLTSILRQLIILRYKTNFVFYWSKLVNLFCAKRAPILSAFYSEYELAAGGVGVPDKWYQLWDFIRKPGVSKNMIIGDCEDFAVNVIELAKHRGTRGAARFQLLNVFYKTDVLFKAGQGALGIGGHCVAFFWAPNISDDPLSSAFVFDHLMGQYEPYYKFIQRTKPFLVLTTDTEGRFLEVL